MKTVAQWLAGREPAPPLTLRRRLAEALGAESARDARDAAEVCLAAGERLLVAVLSEEEANRDYALDLLAADALVTYAFEAASERTGDLSGRAAQAMSRIARLGATTASERPASHAARAARA